MLTQPHPQPRPARRHLLPALVLLLLVLAGLVRPPGASAQRGQEMIDAYLARTGELLVWAQDLVAETESGPARRVLDQAHQLHQRSRDLMNGERPVEAMSVARRARDAVWHAVRLAREAMGLEERIRIRAERFRDLHQDLTERAREERNEQAGRFLDRARQQADRAREMVGQGSFEQAWNLLEQAGDLMQRAARLLADGAGPERLDAQLDRARHAVERSGDRLGPDAAPHQRELLAEAEEALERAGAARAEGRPGRALQLAGLAESLARRAVRPPGSGPDDDALRRQLDTFDGRAERLGDQVRVSGAAQARERFDQALRQRDEAAAQHRAGNPEQALRRIRAAHDLLNQVEDLVR